jgi:cytochrome c
MKKIIKLLVFTFFTGIMSFAYADYELLVKSNCLACHYVDKRKYGPKLKDIAEKYANEANATQMLATKIQTGGAGVWGMDMMPPQPQVSDEDAIKLAEYILSLK